MNNVTLSYIILGVSILSSLLPLFLGKRQNNALLWYYILTGFCFELVLTSLKRIIRIDGFDYHWIGTIYFLVEFVFISFYYRTRVFSQRSTFYLVFISLVVFYLFTSLTDISLSPSNVNSIGSAGLLLAYIAYSIAGFYKILKEQTITRLERSPFFWANTAFLLYSAGSIIVFICIDYLLIEDKELLYALWIFRNILNVTKNIIFARVLTLKD